MLPTMSTHGEAILENRFSFFRHGAASLHRGSMITFHSPLSPSRVVCKRIIGLPGDIVCVDPTGLKAPSTEHAVVPKGHIWVAGDNASWSTDSRDYGPVPMGLVRGHMFARVSVIFIFLVRPPFALQTHCRIVWRGWRELTLTIFCADLSV